MELYFFWIPNFFYTALPTNGLHWGRFGACVSSNGGHGVMG